MALSALSGAKKKIQAEYKRGFEDAILKVAEFFDMTKEECIEYAKTNDIDINPRLSQIKLIETLVMGTKT